MVINPALYVHFEFLAQSSSLPFDSIYLSGLYRAGNWNTAWMIYLRSKRSASSFPSLLLPTTTMSSGCY